MSRVSHAHLLYLVTSILLSDRDGPIDPVDFFFSGNLLLNKFFSGIADASEEFSKEVFMFFNEKIASFPIERSTETWVKMFGTYVTSVCLDDTGCPRGVHVPNGTKTSVTTLGVVVARE